MATASDAAAGARPVMVALAWAGVLLAIVGVVAFNVGYIGLYGAFLPLLCIGVLLFVEVGEDFFLPLLFFAIASTLLYAVGLFALPLVASSLVIAAPVAVLLRRWHGISLPDTVRRDPRPRWRILELLGILLVALFARYTLYRSGGGEIPLQINEFESLTRFVISEVGGWVVFALGYGLQHQVRYGVLYTPGINFAASLPSLLATGLFLVSPHVAIMTLGLNTFGVAGLYVGTLPVGVAHVLMRTLTLRRAEIEQHNLRLQKMNLELARSERMAAIGQMSSAISHQMLQKVGLLGLQCDLLRDLLHDQTAPLAALLDEARERVEQLNATVTDLNATLSDLLIFSRDFVLHLDACSLEPLLGEINEEMRAVAATHGVDIVYWCESGREPVLVDRIKLKQAVLNLLTNALEVSPPASRIEMTLRAQDETVQVAISDQGPGIPEADMEQVFAPFFSTKERGTGLGLPFAQKIVELHKGSLTARNNPTGGATFLVELPRRPPAQEV
jgi:signal transduction histidine kinase